MEFISDILEQIFFSIREVSFPNITFTAFIDIALVSFLIYKVLIWIKETRAWSLFKGIFILIIISAIAYIFDLYTITWIISNTFNVGVIAIIVIFQPEIRKALEQLGTTKGGFGLSFTNETEGKLSALALDEILSACEKMAQEGIGAIIVIQNEVPLGEHQSTGVPIDAIVSTQLLLNIFEDKTPLHDGAVIIKDNKIASASCILPLTKREIGLNLGTRHRAGVGMSEVSDAFVIIVSEETRSISLAHDGKIQKAMSVEDIKKTIRYTDIEEVKGKKKRGKKKKGKNKGKDLLKKGGKVIG